MGGTSPEQELRPAGAWPRLADGAFSPGGNFTRTRIETSARPARGTGEASPLGGTSPEQELRRVVIVAHAPGGAGRGGNFTRTRIEPLFAGREPMSASVGPGGNFTRTRIETSAA